MTEDSFEAGRSEGTADGEANAVPRAPESTHESYVEGYAKGYREALDQQTATCLNCGQPVRYSVLDSADETDQCQQAPDGVAGHQVAAVDFHAWRARVATVESLP
jgi:hypothetical protein